VNSGRVIRIDMLRSAVVKRNNDEERFARIEQMVESLRREAAGQKLETAKLVMTVAGLAPAIVSPNVQELARDISHRFDTAPHDRLRVVTGAP
jgi:hypothetical protein